MSVDVPPSGSYSLSPPSRLALSPRTLDLLLTSISSPTPILRITHLLRPSPCVLLPPLLSSRQLLVTEIDWS